MDTPTPSATDSHTADFPDARLYPDRWYVSDILVLYDLVAQEGPRPIREHILKEIVGPSHTYSSLLRMKRLWDNAPRDCRGEKWLNARYQFFRIAEGFARKYPPNTCDIDTAPLTRKRKRAPRKPEIARRSKQGTAPRCLSLAEENTHSSDSDSMQDNEPLAHDTASETTSQSPDGMGQDPEEDAPGVMDVEVDCEPPALNNGSCRAKPQREEDVKSSDSARIPHYIIPKSTKPLLNDGLCIVDASEIKPHLFEVVRPRKKVKQEDVTRERPIVTPARPFDISRVRVHANLGGVILRDYTIALQIVMDEAKNWRQSFRYQMDPDTEGTSWLVQINEEICLESFRLVLQMCRNTRLLDQLMFEDALRVLFTSDLLGMQDLRKDALERFRAIFMSNASNEFQCSPRHMPAVYNVCVQYGLVELAAVPLMKHIRTLGLSKDRTHLVSRDFGGRLDLNQFPNQIQNLLTWVVEVLKMSHSLILNYFKPSPREPQFHVCSQKDIHIACYNEHGRKKAWTHIGNKLQLDGVFHELFSLIDSLKQIPFGQFGFCSACSTMCKRAVEETHVRVHYGVEKWRRDVKVTLALDKKVEAFKLVERLVKFPEPLPQR